MLEPALAVLRAAAASSAAPPVTSLAELSALTEALCLRASCVGGEGVRAPMESQGPRKEPWLPAELQSDFSFTLSLVGLRPPPPDEGDLGPAAELPALPAPALARNAFEKCLSPAVCAALQGRLCHDWSVFELAAACAGTPGAAGPLQTLALVLWADHGLVADACDVTTRRAAGGSGPEEPLELGKVAAYLAAVEAGYQDVPYHNALHAADALHSLNYLLVASGLAGFTALERMAALLAASVHDLGHPGIASSLLVAARAPLALRYNDRAVLEQFHASSAMTLLAQPEYNFTAEMSPPDAALLRRLVVKLVLQTDMAEHAGFMAGVGKRVAVGLDFACAADREVALELLLKCADVGSCVKSVAGAVRWGCAILTEFFNQGELERSLGLPVSPLCSRADVRVTTMQMGFLEHVAGPLFKLLGCLAPVLAVPTADRIARTRTYFATQEARLSS